MSLAVYVLVGLVLILMPSSSGAPSRAAPARLPAPLRRAFARREVRVINDIKVIAQATNT
jgi:hypothetical protein